MVRKLNNEHTADDVLSESGRAELAEECPQNIRESVTSLVPLYYQQLKQIARRERGKLQPYGTLNTTAVVHEAYIRMAGDTQLESKEHFLRTSVIAMRYVIIDRVRAQLAAKRGGGQTRVDLEQAGHESFTVENDEETLAVHEALIKLKVASARLADVAECRYFGGYTDAETAEALGTSVRTVRRDWNLAKTWLARELGLNVASSADSRGASSA